MAFVTAGDSGFDGAVAVITGGAVGLGRAFARALAEAGAAVALVDVDRAGAEQTAAQLRADRARAVAVVADVADEDQMAAAVQAVVAELGGVDILINNAGLHLMRYNQPFAALPRAELRRLLEVNVVGVVNATLACREAMRDRGGGAVLNVSSMAGYLSTTPYGVSKLAVRGLTTAFAAELAADGIRVNGIAPGLTTTESTLGELPYSLMQQIVAERQLITRPGTTDDAVSAMLYLCSRQASFVTGETLKISGGYPLYV